MLYSICKASDIEYSRTYYDVVVTENFVNPYYAALIIGDFVNFIEFVYYWTYVFLKFLCRSILYTGSSDPRADR